MCNFRRKVVPLRKSGVEDEKNRRGGVGSENLEAHVGEKNCDECMGLKVLFNEEVEDEENEYDEVLRTKQICEEGGIKFNDDSGDILIKGLIDPRNENMRENSEVLEGGARNAAEGKSRRNRN
ncbi:hypothetical protein PIB30_098522 [Stylosanthes scabra]|uniref:Uncharacterized protein n=1 Tax=Stylosanthes scabra TaxID=79078 RepID=A0ABU6XW81_9FABA|nr:hypothetical protein [Stylosanthes scabra]